MGAFIPDVVSLVETANVYLAPIAVFIGALSTILGGAIVFWKKVLRSRVDEVMAMVREVRDFVHTVNAPWPIPQRDGSTKELPMREAFTHLAEGQVEILAGLDRSQAWRDQHDQHWPMTGEVTMKVEGEVTMSDPHTRPSHSV